MGRFHETLLPAKEFCCAQAQRKAGINPDADTDMAATTSAEALQQSAEDRAEAFSLGKRDRTDEASTSAGTPWRVHAQPCTSLAHACLTSCTGSTSRASLHPGGPHVHNLRINDHVDRAMQAALLGFWPCRPSTSGAEPGTAAAEGSRKAFFKDFRHVVQEADIILEVLDARDPLASRCLDIERHIRRAGATKKIVLILNKIGVAPAQRQHPLCRSKVCEPSLSMRLAVLGSPRRREAGSILLNPLGTSGLCLSAPAQLAAEVLMTAPSWPDAVPMLTHRCCAQIWCPRRRLSAG